jgi:hypothetical protein
MTNTGYYIVEVFTNNQWNKHSFHKGQEYAEVNMDVASRSKRCPARIIYNGNIVAEVANW